MKLFINQIVRKEKAPVYNVSYVFCSDQYLLKINQNYLGHDDYTDTITFNIGTKEAIEGEIYISVERVKENAKSFLLSFQEELHRVIFHSLLHLCGYEDKSAGQKALMRKKEDYYLKRYLDVSRGT